MNYLEFKFSIPVIEPYRDMLLYYLNELGFETHQETPEGLISYILVNDFNEEALEEVISDLGQKIKYSYKEIEQQNWNKVWEASFDPVWISDDCVICAPFHDVKDAEYKIILSPKMAFGTGHHPTTFLITQQLLEENVEGLDVLDMGCGTSVLGIMASMRGAASVDGIDIDEWSQTNSEENLALNNIENMQVELGDVTLLDGRTYNVILANINKNVLLSDMPEYEKVLTEGGFILFSGFYENDIESIVDRGEELGLTFVESKVRKEWAMVKMKK